MPRFTSCVTAAIPLIAAVAIGAGCGGGSNSADAHGTIDGGTGIDSGTTDAPVGGLCGTADFTVSTYPGTASGAIVGSTGMLTVAMGVCAVEGSAASPFYDAPDGATQVVLLTGLTSGTTYDVNLAADDDLLFFVATGCGAMGPTGNQCLLFEDDTFGTDSATMGTGIENGIFVAPASGTVAVIVGTADSADLTDASKPLCSPSFTCVACLSDFDCTASATPSCDTTTTNTCIAGIASTCTGDDADEPDNYPSEAHALTFPTVNTPTVKSAAVCNIPDTESDFYSIVVPTDNTTLAILIDWTTAGADLDANVFDDAGNLVAQGDSSDPSEHFSATFATAGTYYLQVLEYSSGDETNGPMTSAVATPYTVTLEFTNCATSFDCTNVAKPVCDTTDDICIAGPTSCTGDDAADNGNGDDGPVDATNIIVATGNTSTVINADACDLDPNEADWYKTTVVAGEGLVVTTSWTPTTNAFLTLVMDSTGNTVGAGEYENPSVVTLSYLPAGTYFIEVINNNQPAITAAVPYSITVRRTASQACATASDCGADFDTQLFRGDCQSSDHACHFITATGAVANGAACDSNADCTSQFCTYAIEQFASNPQTSVCGDPDANCAADTDCATGFTCLVTDGVCIPACTQDTDCGADPSISTVSSGLPWAYGTCDIATGDCTAPVDPNAGN